MGTPTALTIGNFDGAHQGHRGLIEAAREAAGGSGRVVGLVFDPHPQTVLGSGHAKPRLSTLAQRRRWIEAAGADEVIAIAPTPAFLAQSPAEFIHGLVKRHRPRWIVEGPDFRFGRGRAGTVQTLSELGAEAGFDTVVIEPVTGTLADQHLVTVSSSSIRWLLERGRVGDAATLLGRPYELQCPVVMGDQRGRDLGVPTANLDHGDYLLPADGIYAGSALGPDQRWYPAAVSVGTKPSFGAHPRLVEAHLIGFIGPLDDYGWTITLHLSSWLRDQVTYDRIDHLIEQIGRDIAAAQAIWDADSSARATVVSR